MGFLHNGTNASASASACADGDNGGAAAASACAVDANGGSASASADGAACPDHGPDVCSTSTAACPDDRRSHGSICSDSSSAASQSVQCSRQERRWRDHPG